MTDYWLSKLFYELQDPAKAAAYRADRAATIDRFPLAPAVRAALIADDVAAIAPLVNPYLLRYYFTASGMADRDFLAKLHAMGKAPAHG